MAKDKNVTIVIKKIQGGKAGSHGGAWKVAYADFVTAMMAFFLVMWLMSYDESTKQEVSQYFKHPNSHKKNKDITSERDVNLGQRLGEGDTILTGAGGQVPEDLVETPLRDLKQEVEQKLGDVMFGLELNADVEVLKFSIQGDDLFVDGSSEIKKDAYPYLDRMATIFGKVQGSVLIEGHLDKNPAPNGQDPYLFSTERAIAVMDYFVKKHKMDEDRFCPRGIASRRAWSNPVRGVASNDPRNRRVEFTVSPKNPCIQ